MNAITTGAPSAPWDRNKKRGPCYNFQRDGTCKFGTKCRFEHISKEDAAARDKRGAEQHCLKVEQGSACGAEPPTDTKQQCQNEATLREYKPGFRKRFELKIGFGEATDDNYALCDNGAMISTMSEGVYSKLQQQGVKFNQAGMSRLKISGFVGGGGSYTKTSVSTVVKVYPEEVQSQFT